MTDKTLEALYAKMAALTLPECAKTCKVPFSCCSLEYCEFAEQFAISNGTPISRTGNEKLPFMGPNGCTMPPHLRPLCTLHTCEINSVGIKRGDLKWTEDYFELRETIEELELRSTF